MSDSWWGVMCLIWITIPKSSAPRFFLERWLPFPQLYNLPWSWFGFYYLRAVCGPNFRSGSMFVSAAQPASFISSSHEDRIWGPKSASEWSCWYHCSERNDQGVKFSGCVWPECENAYKHFMGLIRVLLHSHMWNDPACCDPLLGWELAIMHL